MWASSDIGASGFELSHRLRFAGFTQYVHAVFDWRYCHGLNALFSTAVLSTFCLECPETLFYMPRLAMFHRKTS